MKRTNVCVTAVTHPCRSLVLDYDAGFCSTSPVTHARRCCVLDYNDAALCSTSSVTHARRSRVLNYDDADFRQTPNPLTSPRRMQEACTNGPRRPEQSFDVLLPAVKDRDDRRTHTHSTQTRIQDSIVFSYFYESLVSLPHRHIKKEQQRQ